MSKKEQLYTLLHMFLRGEYRIPVFCDAFEDIYYPDVPRARNCLRGSLPSLTHLPVSLHVSLPSLRTFPHIPMYTAPKPKYVMQFYPHAVLWN